MAKKTHKDYFGELRLPVPPPSHPQTTKKGEKGYSRKKSKEIVKREEKEYDPLVDWEGY